MTDFNELLQEEFNWSLVHTVYSSVDNMSDEEVRQSILEDLLFVTIHEKENNVKVDFKRQQLLRYLRGPRYFRVLKQLQNMEIAGLIEETETSIRIRDDQEILNAAQEYSGVFYKKFYTKEIPADVLFLNEEVVQESIEKHGSFDNMVKSMAMELEASCETVKTLN